MRFSQLLRPLKVPMLVISLLIIRIIRGQTNLSYSFFLLSVAFLCSP
jgi:hypothetical protein